MKKYLQAVVFAAFLQAAPAFAWNYGEFISCSALNPMPTVTLKSSYGLLVHDLRHSTAEISALAGGRVDIVDGLATHKLNAGINLKNIKVLQIDNQNTCVLPAEIELFIGFDNPEIYVSKDYDYNSCRFSVVIRHEQVHQRINKLLLEHFLPLLFAELQQAVQDVKALKVDTPSEAKAGAQRLANHYQQRLTPVLHMFRQLMIIEQQKLDNLTNYQMEWELCRQYDANHFPKSRGR